MGLCGLCSVPREVGPGHLPRASVTSSFSATGAPRGVITQVNWTSTSLQTQVQLRFIIVLVDGALSSVSQVDFRLNY